MFRIARERTLGVAAYWCSGRPMRDRRDLAVFASPEALQQLCDTNQKPPEHESVLEPRAGTPQRGRLCQELAAACSIPNIINATVGSENLDEGDCHMQDMPFRHDRAAAYYYQARPDIVLKATKVAAAMQRNWEDTPVEERCATVERAAKLIAGEQRHHIIAGAMTGQAMTAIQAEYNICQLVDYLRFGCCFMRDLTKSRCVPDGGKEAYNRNQYHGLEGFWAAITSSDSLSLASQLAITPVIMGNCVVWKPSDNAVLACYRVFECLIRAGLPPGVLNFVPADKTNFLSIVTSNPDLAGISFAGTTATLERIWRTVGEQIKLYKRFPRVVGTGSGKNFHVVHSSADLHNAVACTARAAFEMAGQKAMSCSRVFVAQSVLNDFVDSLKAVSDTLLVTHPLDYRCFMSALVSQEALDKAIHYMSRAASDKDVKLVCGGRFDSSVGYYVEPTVYLLADPGHELMCHEVRGPLLCVCPFDEDNGKELVDAVGKAPYAITGSIFAKDASWAQFAVRALRDFAPSLLVNDRCSEELPADQSVGGGRKSGNGAKAGSISYLLHFGTERSLREKLHPSCDVTYPYMHEVPADVIPK